MCAMVDDVLDETRKKKCRSYGLSSLFGSTGTVAVTFLFFFFSCSFSAPRFSFLFRAWLPPKYFLPVRTLLSCLAHTWNSSHASFAVPSKKNFLLNFNQMAAARILVEPFLGCLAIAAVLCFGRRTFFSFSCSFSSDVFCFMSSTRFKNFSQTLNWMRG